MAPVSGGRACEGRRPHCDAPCCGVRRALGASRWIPEMGELMMFPAISSWLHHVMIRVKSHEKTENVMGQFMIDLINPTLLVGKAGLFSNVCR